MKAIEILVLLLVVVHALQHLPDDVRHGRGFVEKIARQISGGKPSDWKARFTIFALTALIISISASPIIYYGLECGLQMFSVREH